MKERELLEQFNDAAQGARPLDEAVSYPFSRLVQARQFIYRHQELWFSLAMLLALYSASHYVSDSSASAKIYDYCNPIYPQSIAPDIYMIDGASLSQPILIEALNLQTDGQLKSGIIMIDRFPGQVKIQNPNQRTLAFQCLDSDVSEPLSILKSEFSAKELTRLRIDGSIDR